jgi:hypothetical protein
MPGDLHRPSLEPGPLHRTHQHALGSPDARLELDRPVIDLRCAAMFPCRPGVTNQSIINASNLPIGRIHKYYLSNQL